MRPEDGRRLLTWHRATTRRFPWRGTSDAYRLAITELMLVRTRADQVADVWDGFFARYPDVGALADAPDHEVLGALRPLGLRWRAARIKAFARIAATDPLWYDRASELPGGGPYMVGALRLGVQGWGSVPVDVTLARLLSRYYGLTPDGEARRDKAIIHAAVQLGRRSRRFFHAMLDLAALVCLPRAPRCPACPLRMGCRYASSTLPNVSIANTSSSSP